VNEKYEQEIPLNWVRRAGRPTKPKPVTEVPTRIPRIARLMALAIKFQDMVDRGEVRDYADIARLGYVTRARLTQIMNLLLLAPDIQEGILFSTQKAPGNRAPEQALRKITAIPNWRKQRLILLEHRISFLGARSVDPTVGKDS
jgi:hypothetical protein